MHGWYRKLLMTLVFCCVAAGPAGCARLNPFGRSNVDWLGRRTSDTVPGLTPPAERIATLRKMGRKAAWAKPDEQERISGQLAAAFPAEADPLIRMEIVRALAGYPTASAASALDAALEDADPDVRIAACKVWGERGGPEAAAKLSGVLASDLDQDVRLAAARALGETGDLAAVGALGEVLEEGDPAMQYRAVQSLRNVTGEDFGNDVNRWRQYVKGELPTPQKPVSIVRRIRQWF